jgi:hypothetical protein
MVRRGERRTGKVCPSTQSTCISWWRGAEGREKKCIPQIDGHRPVAWSEGMAHILDCLHAEVWGVQVCRIQLFQVEDRPHAATFLEDEEDGADVARRREWNLFDGPLGKEGLHLLVYVVIVLALRGGGEMRPRQGERRGEVKWVQKPVTASRA